MERVVEKEREKWESEGEPCTQSMQAQQVCVVRKKKKPELQEEEEESACAGRTHRVAGAVGALGAGSALFPPSSKDVTRI